MRTGRCLLHDERAVLAQQRSRGSINSPSLGTKRNARPRKPPISLRRPRNRDRQQPINRFERQVGLVKRYRELRTFAPRILVVLARAMVIVVGRRVRVMFVLVIAVVTVRKFGWGLRFSAPPRRCHVAAKARRAPQRDKKPQQEPKCARTVNHWTMDNIRRMKRAVLVGKGSLIVSTTHQDRVHALRTLANTPSTTHSQPTPPPTPPPAQPRPT